MTARNVLILGTGPAGLTAALYAARADLKPLVVEGLEAGGQLMITSDVENFPGFPEGIQGPELMDLLRKQAERFGAEFAAGDAKEVLLAGDVKTVATEKESYRARTLIIATGATARFLGLESEKALQGRGVSACATCDGFFFRDKVVAVVGGGDSAMEEALFLTRFASKVYVIHRRDELRASKIMGDRARAHEKIEFVWNSLVRGVLDPEAGKVTGLKLLNVKNEDSTTLAVEGLFLALGHDPNTKLFRGQIDLDDKGYITTHDGTHTSVPGVFACGDVQDHVYRQAVTAAGTGCMAALDAQHYIEG